MIQRILKGRLKKLCNHFPAIAILGARQVGKTTLAKVMMDELPKESIYIDLENPSHLARLENKLAFFSANAEKCIVIDEVQRMPDLFPVLRSVIDMNREPCRFILLGSASPELAHLSSETLAGRIVYTELSPFLYDEIKNMASLQTHWLKGGFPEPFQIKDDDIREEWLNSFILTYIERELPSFGLSTSFQNLSRFFSMLSHTHGQLLNKSTYSKSLELSVPIIAKYLDYLESAFIIRTLQSFFINIKKRLSKTPKVYIRDSGLLHHQLKIMDYNSLLGHPGVGHSWEGYIIEQVISTLGNKYEYFFYRTQDGAECDLIICERYSPIACVEVKFSSSPKKTKSLTTAINDIKTEKNYIVIPDCKDPYPLDKNLIVCDLPTLIGKLN
jgi:uncharacterized protein